MTDDDELLAAEFALGLLDEAEAQGVRARARVDAMMALRISWWRDQLAPLAGEAVTPAPEGVWQKIEAQLPGNDNSMTLMQRWRAAAVGAMAVAAALAVFVGTRPAPPVAVTPAAPMVAALAGEKGGVVAVGYDATSGKLVVAPTTLDPGRGDAELWIIPEGGKPVSLGVIDAKNAANHQVPDAKRALLVPGATFAITQEAHGGSPDGNPHGEILVSGKIIRT